VRARTPALLEMLALLAVPALLLAPSVTRRTGFRDWNCGYAKRIPEDTAVIYVASPSLLTSLVYNSTLNQT
jgi:hypothetical protein